MEPVKIELKDKKAKNPGDRGPIVLPEMVDSKDREWAIKDVSAPEAKVDYETSSVELPMGADTYELATRAHQLGRVAYTAEDLLEKAGVVNTRIARPTTPTIPPDLVNAVEDGRVNARLIALDVATPDPSALEGFDELKVLNKMGEDPMFAACVRAAALGTEFEPRVARQLNRFWPMFAPGIEAEVAKLSDANATNQTTVDVSNAIFQLLLFPPPPGGGGGEGEEGEGEGEEDGQPGEGGGEGRPGKGNKGKGKPKDGDPGDQDTPSLEDIMNNAPPSARKPPKSKPKYEPPKPRTNFDWEKWRNENWQGFDLSSFFRNRKPIEPTPQRAQQIEAQMVKLQGMMEEADEGELDVGGHSEGELVCEGMRSMVPHTIDRHNGTAEWKKMKTDEPPRSIRVRSKGKGKGPRGEYYGRVVRYPQRMYSDRRIFKSKRGRLQFPGAVLIDCSGSMALSVEQIQSVLEGYPAAEIRGYSSIQRYGLLRTFVRKGKRVHSDYMSLPGGGNGIDGLALRWLATMPRPRFWISDGQVTGQVAGGHEGMTANLVYDSLEVMARARIARFHSVEAFLEKFDLPSPGNYEPDDGDAPDAAFPTRNSMSYHD